jgi:hypothetical protein
MKRKLKQRKCTCKHHAIPEEVVFDREKISRLRGDDVFSMRKAYNTVTSDTAIMLQLGPATALVEKMRNIGCLDFKTWLRVSPHFAEHTILNTSQFTAATCAANELISKLLIYLTTSLSPLPARTRTLSVKDLLKEMQDVLRLEIFWWTSEWCFRNQPSKPRGLNKAATKAQNLREGFGLARALWVEGMLNKGVCVLLERMESVVELVVATFWWWDRSVKKEAQEEDKEGHVSEQEVESE